MDLFFILALCLIVTVTGTFFSIPALVPPLRHRARQSRHVRRGLALGLSGITFVIYFGALASLGASMATLFTEPAYPFGLFEHDDVRNTQLQRELTLQYLFPPDALPDGHCFSDDTVICEGTMTVLAKDTFSLETYLWTIGLSLLAATGCRWSARRITRPRRKHKRASAL